MVLTLALAALLSATPAEKKEAATHYQRGISLYKEANYSAALSEFKAAWQALPSWEVLFNIGLCQRRLFQYGPAIKSFDRYLAEGGAKVPADRRAAVDQELQQIRALTATVAIIVKGERAKVLIDGEPVGETPLSELVLLGPGKHLVRAERDGCAPDEKSIEVVSGQAQAVELDPKSLTAPARVTVECAPAGALVSVDADAERRCPFERELTPGTHELVARADGYAQLRTEVIVQPAQPRTVRLTLVSAAPPARPFPVLGVSLLGGGVVLGALGTTFALLANAAGKDVTALASTGGAWDAKAIATQAGGRRDTVLGWTFLGLGGAALAAGVVVLVLQPGAPPTSGAAQLRLGVSPTGVFACGSF
ncbi:MAG: PEGA domain-containing protein [Myxococcota bacterium]